MPRNTSGIYTLPGGNPVTPGDVIEAEWANTTLEDVADALTNSLSRTGAGGMLAPFRIADGSISAPGLSYLNETNTGLYRNGSGSTWMSVLGVNVAQFSTVGLTIPFGKALTAQGNASVSGTFAVSGATTLSSTLSVTGAITATGGVVGNVTGNVTAASGSSSFNDVTISGSLDMVPGSSATITGLNNPVNASDAANKGYVDAQDALKLSLTGGTMSGNIAMGGNLVTGLGAPSAGGDATNKTYVDAQDALRLALAGGTMSGAIAMGSSKITGLGTPTADADAATKAYVDSIAQGLDVKGSCRVATVANITLSGTQTIDGVAVIAGDRVLVKDQSTAANNGIYVVAAGSWSRATDADTWTELVGAFTFVEEGTVNDNSGWVCTSPAGGTLGVTAVTWEQFSGAGQITAGAGMYKSGNTLNVGTASASRIVVNADDIDLATTGVTASTYKSVTVDAYGRVTAGTNPTTLAGFGITDAYTSAQVDTLVNAKLSLTGGTMSGAIAMGGNKVTGLGTPTNAGDAATKTYVDTADALKLNLSGGTMSGVIAMGANKITGLADPTNPQDAATKTYIDTIFGSTTSAAASATAAAASASAAATSATNAANSATAAAGSATSASTTYTNFNNQYLGSKTSDPATNNTGGALVAGNLYWNTTFSEMRVYNGSSWVAAYIPAAGYLALTGGTMTGAITFASAQTFDATKLTGIAPVVNGGTGASTASGARTNLGLVIGTDVPSPTGTGASGTWNISVTGNAATATSATSATTATTATNVSGGTASVTTLSASGAVTFSGGTANSVAYLNGSKVVTTGSALQFDGANLGIGGAPITSVKLAVYGDSHIRGGFGLAYFDSTNANYWAQYNSSGAFIFSNGTERARFDSAGNMSLGSSSSNERLYIYSASGNSKVRTDSGANQVYMGWDSADAIAEVATNGAWRIRTGSGFTERLRVATTGAFGLSGANYGTSGQVLTSQGSGSAPVWSSPAGGGIGGMQVFTSSGTFTIPAGKTTIKVTVVGGGGGGGKPEDYSSTAASGGGGGGGAVTYYTGVTPGATLTVTVGAGGTGATSQRTNGSNGGTTTVSSGTQTISSTYATGGDGGNWSTPAGFGGGGNGTLSISGGGGGTAVPGFRTPGGFGGNSMFGAGARMTSGSAGANGGGYGGGGAGGAYSGATALNGGNGGAGVVIFEY